MRRYKVQDNQHQIIADSSRHHVRKKRKAGSKFFCFILLIMLVSLFIIFELNGNLSELPDYFENRFHPSYDRLPLTYSPFDKPSVLAESLFKQNRAEYSESEKIQTKREPASVEFFVRLHAGMTNTDYMPETADKLVGNSLPHYVQWDQRWGFHSYIGEPFALTGCGPCCLSMVYTGLTGNTDLPPDLMADFAMQNGYYVENIGTAWSLFDEGAAQLGLNPEKLALEQTAFDQALDAGKLIILSLTPGDFTTVGHFIVVWSHDGDNYHILDPFNVKLSRRSWKYSVLISQTAAAWAFSKNIIN